MGGILSCDTSEEIVSDLALIKEYQKVSLEDVMSSLETYQDMQATGECGLALSIEEFDEVFGLLCADPNIHFDHYNVRKESKIDGYEAFAAAIVFCNEASLEKKLTALFHMFDFDHSSEISASELVILMMSTSRGLCKVATIRRPTVIELESIAKEAFAEIDTDNSSNISAEEFTTWAKHHDGIASYLKKFAGIRLISDAQKKYDKFLSTAVKSFNSCCNDSKECTIEDVCKIISNIDGSPPRDEEVEAYIDLMKASKDATSINVSEFVATIAPFLAFEVADDNQSDSVDKAELKILLWLMRQKEPSPMQVDNVLSAVDEDGSGTVSRLEWVSYISIADKSSGSISFNAQMATLFDECDADQSGSISSIELASNLKAIVTRSVLQHNALISPAQLVFVEDLLTSLASELVDIVDENGNQNIEWKEFKAHLDLIESRIAKVKKYVLEHVYHNK